MSSLSRESLSESLKAQIREIVDCGCCEIDETAIENVAVYLVDWLGLTDADIADLSVSLATEADSCYSYDLYIRKVKIRARKEA